MSVESQSPSLATQLEPTFDDLRNPAINTVDKDPLETEQILDQLANIEDLTRLYFREVRQIPLLTKDVEIALGQRILRGHYARKLSSNPTLREDTQAILTAHIQSGLEAQQALAAGNTRLVISIAKNYRDRGVELLEIIQEANKFLLIGAAKFDYRLGFKFSTYATRWIRKGCQHAIDQYSHAIRPSRDTQKLIRMLHHIESQLTQQLSRKPTPQELSNALEVDLADVEHILAMEQIPASLEGPSHPNEDNQLLSEAIPDDNATHPLDHTHNLLLAELLAEALKYLDPRQAAVLSLHYIEGLTLEKIGAHPKVVINKPVTREMVRQLENQGIKNLINKLKKLNPALLARLESFLKE